MTPLFLSAFLLNTGLTITLIGIVFYLIDRFQANLFQLGLLSGIGAFVFMGAAWFCGRFFSRHYTAKTLTRVGVFCFILGFFFIPHLPSLRWVYLVYPIGSFGMGIFWPSLERWISSVSDGDALRRLMGLFNLSWGPGQIIAPFLAGPSLKGGGFFPSGPGSRSPCRSFFSFPPFRRKRGTRPLPVRKDPPQNRQGP